MSGSLRFVQEEAFQRQTGRMLVAGGLSGLSAHVAKLVWPEAWGNGSVAPLVVIAMSVAYASACDELRKQYREAAIFAISAVLAALAHSSFQGDLEWLGTGFFALVLAVLVHRGREEEGTSWPLLFASFVASLLALLVHHKLSMSIFFVGIPGWATAGSLGLSFGLVLSLGNLSEYLEVFEDKLEIALASYQGKFSGEIGALLEKSMAHWKKIDALLEKGAPVRPQVESTVLRLLDVAKRWQQVEEEKPVESEADLKKRISEMEEKIANADDAIVRQQYEKARASLSEQLKYMKQIALSRERVVARLHNYLTSLERLRLAVLNHRSADASRLSSEVQPVLKELEMLGQELDTGTEAHSELERLSTTPL
jgi:hypothetical protein